MSTPASIKPRSRLPSFGRPTKITARTRKPKVEDVPITPFEDFVKNRGRNSIGGAYSETDKDVEDKRPFARVNILSPSDRVILMELTVALRESTDTHRELGGLSPIDRSPKDEEVSVEAAEDEEPDAPENEPEAPSNDEPEAS